MTLRLLSILLRSSLINWEVSELYKEFIHFGLTSQDINNTSVPLSIKDALQEVYYPTAGRIDRPVDTLCGGVERYSDAG